MALCGAKAIPRKKHRILPKVFLHSCLSEKAWIQSGRRKDVYVRSFWHGKRIYSQTHTVAQWLANADTAVRHSVRKSWSDGSMPILSHQTRSPRIVFISVHG